MVTAVESNNRTGHRQRTKSAASGPRFTVPVLPDGKGEGTTVSVPVGVAASPVTASVSAPSCPDLGRFVGRSVGSGQCVALAKAVQPGLGSTGNWRCGEKVQGNTALQPGTVIATFNRASRYANATDGSSHAAVYLGQDAKGVRVLDQWSGKAASIRTIPWHNPGGAAANTGTAFHVVRSAAAV